MLTVFLATTALVVSGNAEVTRSGDGRWRLTARGKTSIVSNTVGSCLVTRIH